MPTSRFLKRLSSIADANWWPLALFTAVMATLWSMMYERAAHDDQLVIQEALVNHQNVAVAMANHTEQMLDRLRFYGHTLTMGTSPEVNRQLIRSAKGRDPSFLRLMQFDAQGRPIYTTGAQPEPWLRDMAKAYARQHRNTTAEDITIGNNVPPEALTQAWSLPVIYSPSRPTASTAGFMIALVDLGSFPRRFDNMALGRSGEIVLVDDSGREILRMHQGRLDFVETIAGTERYRRAFAEPAGTVIEQVKGAHDRLYAFRRVIDTPLAVLVSRTRYDVLLQNQATQRGYWLTTLGLTLLMVLFTLRWIGAARRKRQLMTHLARSQEENARLIAQLEEEKQAAYKLATHDKLTGLANRMLFAEIAERYIARAQRVRGRFAVMFIDLDRFKPINDTHGHKAGDQILIEVAQRLQACVRQTDMVARLGGDEFVALVGDLHGSHDAAAIAGKIVESLHCPFTGIVADELFVTPSIGIALYPDDASSIEQLVRQADGAMYQAKSRGRATYVFADSSLNRRNDMKNQIQAALPLALKHHEITMHYQPKVSLRDFSITGLEALARWHSPQLGDVSPADFVPLAEENSLILELGEYVIDSVCAQLESWQRAGIPMVPVAINVSPRQLRSAQLYDYLSSALAAHGLAPRHIEIEITETGLIDSDDGLVEQLRRLDGLGIHLAIDDFGTGFSGLSHLRALPVKHLKIDRSFITDIRNDLNDATIVSSTISLAHNLHLLAIAEGVETREQLAHLRASGCDQAQGYLFSRPLPANEIPPLLTQQCILGKDL